MFHGLAMVACLFNALPFALRMLGFSAVAFSVMQSLKQNRQTSRLIELSYSDSGGWTIVDGIACLPIDLSASTISTAWIIVLHYRPRQQSKKTLLILHDSVSTEEYRLLRVSLRIAAVS